MRFSTPACPECGKPAIGTLEHLSGWAEFNGDPIQGPVDYSGTTHVDWDQQRTKRDDVGRPWLTCEQGHAWTSFMELPSGVKPPKIKDSEMYLRTKIWRDRFLADAATAETTPVPASIDPKLWQAYKASLQSMADELTGDLEEYERTH